MKKIIGILSLLILATACHDSVLDIEESSLQNNALNEAQLLTVDPQTLYVSGQPANPNISPEARDLWYYLSGLNTGTSNRLLSGQFADFSTRIVPLDDPTNELKQVFDATGKWPALIGFKYDGTRGPSIPLEIDIVNQQAIEYHNLGGIIHINTNLFNPADPTKGRLGSMDINTVLSTTSGPGQANYDTIYSQWDKVAAGLKELMDLKIPVIFRPYPEMNGAWFWWGKLNSSPAQYMQLYQDLYHYFTNVKGLNNLLWVYEPSALEPMKTAFYPGDAFVDIIGFSAYTAPDQRLTSNFIPADEYNLLKSKGKPLGFTQWGPIRDFREVNFVQRDNMKLLIGGPRHPEDGIKNAYPDIVLWMSWSDNFAIHRHLNATQLMNDPWVIDRSEINITGGGNGNIATVNNPSFESGNLSGWTVGTNASAVSNNAKSGTYAARLGTATSYGSIQQTVSGLSPNTNYVASAYIKAIDGQIFFKVEGSEGSSPSVGVQNTQYQKVVIPFKTGSSSTNVDLIAWSSTATPNSHGYVDDFAVEQALDVKNSGFENGLNNWTAGGEASTSASNARTGSYAASIGTSSANGKVQQTITGLTPSTTYTATAYIKAANGAIFFRANNFGGTNTSQNTQSTSSQSYTPLTVTFKTGPSSTSATLLIWSSTAVNNSYGFADDVSLTND